MLDGERGHHHGVGKRQTHGLVVLDLLLRQAPQEPGGDRITRPGGIGGRIYRQGRQMNVLAVTVEGSALRPFLDDQASGCSRI